MSLSVDSNVVYQKGSFDLDTRSGLTPGQSGAVQSGLGLTKDPTTGADAVAVRIGGGTVVTTSQGVLTLPGKNIFLKPASANYVELLLAAGGAQPPDGIGVSVNATAFTTGAVPLYKITTATLLNGPADLRGLATITAVEDHRGEPVT